MPVQLNQTYLAVVVGDAAQRRTGQHHVGRTVIGGVAFAAPALRVCPLSGGGAVLERRRVFLVADLHVGQLFLDDGDVLLGHGGGGSCCFQLLLALLALALFVGLGRLLLLLQLFKLLGVGHFLEHNRCFLGRRTDLHKIMR